MRPWGFIVGDPPLRATIGERSENGAFRSRKVAAQLGDLLEPRLKAFEIEKLVTPVELFVLVKLEAIWRGLARATPPSTVSRTRSDQRLPDANRGFPRTQLVATA